MDILIHHIFVSQDHNFVGHHGKAPSNNKILDRETVECIAGKGIKGDRFFDYKPDWKGQITFFNMAIYENVIEKFGKQLVNSRPSAFRRNVLTSGVDLNDLIGKEFSIGGVSFSGVEECKPCYWMDQACCQGVHEFLKGNGGLRAKIVSSGSLMRGKEKLIIA